jgi:hypothetical protein
MEMFIELPAQDGQAAGINRFDAEMMTAGSCPK